MTIDSKTLLERSLPNCAKAFNLALTLFIIRVPLSILSPHLSLTLIGLLAFGITIVVVGLVGYLAYQCGWHPALPILPSAALLLPYVGTIILILILIQSRVFLQRHGYRVGLTSARENPDGPVPWPDIPFRKHIPWLMTFAVMPWGLFIFVWILNPDYNAKFFMPYDNWLGIGMLLVAAIASVLTYPLSIQFQCLRAQPKFTGVIKLQFAMVLSLAFLFALITTAIILMGPAAITMQQQMSLMHSTQ